MDALYQKLASQSEGRVVVAGVDELYQTNAIRYKILGFHRFLRETRNYGKPYRLIQVCYRQRSQEASVKRSRLYENQIREAAMACNAEFPGSVELHMLTGSFYPVEERMALWRVAKIYLNTSLAQGLNLHPQEFLMARKEEGGKAMELEMEAIPTELPNLAVVEEKVADSIEIGDDEEEIVIRGSKV